MAYQIAPRPMQPKVIPIRDEDYLDFLRGEPCVVPRCRNVDIEAMHTGGMKSGAAKGRKASDLDAVPGCDYHHRTGPRPEAHHSCPEWMWEAHHGIDLRVERARLWAKFKEGAA